MKTKNMPLADNTRSSGILYVRILLTPNYFHDLSNKTTHHKTSNDSFVYFTPCLRLRGLHIFQQMLSVSLETLLMME